MTGRLYDPFGIMQPKPSRNPFDAETRCVTMQVMQVRRAADVGKNDLIWSVLVETLRPEEWGKVSLSVGASPKEIKAT